ncbi:hypothetical protein Tco_0928713, partial [Tanacetum coccineum]
HRIWSPSPSPTPTKDLDVDGDDDVVATSQILQRWKTGEEKLLGKCWVEFSKNSKIGSDRSDETFWWQVKHDFNEATHGIHRTKDMITGKWAMLNDNCKKFNVIFKRLECNGKSGKSEVDFLDRAKLQFRDESTTETQNFNQEHAWCVLKSCPKWDSAKPVDLVNLTELFGDDARPRPSENLDPQKKQIENDVEHQIGEFIEEFTY